MLRKIPGEQLEVRRWSQSDSVLREGPGEATREARTSAGGWRAGRADGGRPDSVPDEEQFSTPASRG